MAAAKRRMIARRAAYIGLLTIIGLALGWVIFASTVPYKEFVLAKPLDPVDVDVEVRILFLFVLLPLCIVRLGLRYIKFEHNGKDPNTRVSTRDNE
jgi:hypothetical protein